MPCLYLFYPLPGGSMGEVTALSFRQGTAYKTDLAFTSCLGLDRVLKSTKGK